MKQSIASLLLVAGVIVSALAAGESQRVSRAAPVDEQLVGQVLHRPVVSHAQEEHPGIFVYLDRSLEAGTILTAENVSWLGGLGLQEVLVLRRKADQETLPVGPEVLGRVLAQKVVLAAEEETILPGRLITPAFEARLRATDIESLRVTAKRQLEDGSSQREEVQWPLLDEAEGPAGLTLAGSNLRQEISLPVQLKVSSYVDEPLLERLKASHISELAVKLPKAWKFEDWGDRWQFLIGIGLTLLGVVLRRSGPGVEAQADGQHELTRLSDALVALEGQVEAMVQRAGEMDAAALHGAIDPLLTGLVYQIAEGRNAIRAVHGTRVFGSVMDAFARGERKLNRAWSASVDGHVEESRASLTAALPSLREAREALPGTQPPGSSALGSAPGTRQESCAPSSVAQAAHNLGPGDTPLPLDVPLSSDQNSWSDEEPS